jgi:hypothetical protein
VIQKLLRKGTKLIYIPGNHDENLGLTFLTLKVIFVDNTDGAWCTARN